MVAVNRGFGPVSAEPLLPKEAWRLKPPPNLACRNRGRQLAGKEIKILQKLADMEVIEDKNML